jgi:hypothetical protein
MDAKRTSGLVLLAVLSLFCSAVAWAVEHAVFSSVFAALSAVAVFSAAAPRPRRWQGQILAWRWKRKRRT